MIRRTSSRWIAIAALTLLAGGPALAATASAEDVLSNCTNCTAVVDWNPVFECTEPITSGYGLVGCLFASGPPACQSVPVEPAGSGGGSPFPQDLQERPDSEDEGCLVEHETGTYRVTPLEIPPPGVMILREDGSEIDRLHFWEDYPELQWIEIFVDRPDLIARITISGTPTAGLIQVTLNGRAVPAVQTAFPDDAADVTEALAGAIQRAEFTVRLGDHSIEVLRDNGVAVEGGVGLTRVAFESTDPGMVRGEIFLESPLLQPPGFPGL